MKVIIFCNDQANGFDEPTMDPRRPGQVLIFGSYAEAAMHLCDSPDCLSMMKEWMPDKEWCKDVIDRFTWAKQVEVRL